MKLKLFTTSICMALLFGCGNADKVADATTDHQHEQTAGGGQSTVKDDDSQKNIVQVASESPDHTTLVAAVKAADLVDALVNAGPFTVFAPTNAAFDKLPAGTVDDLLKPANKEKLADILQYHVSLGVLKTANFTDGQVIGQVNGNNINIKMENGRPKINGVANIIAELPVANGVIYVIDNVLLPPTK